MSETDQFWQYANGGWSSPGLMLTFVAAVLYFSR